MKSMSNITRVKRSQSGMVSLMVSMMLILIVSLVVVGLAQISRREARLSLDNQLSVQAYYAAESGFNEASKAINDVLSGGGTPANKDSCDDSPLPMYSGIKKSASGLNSDASVRFSCVLIDTQPTYLKLSLGSSSKSLPLVTASGNKFVSIQISWNAANPNGTVANCPLSGNPSSSNWKAGTMTCPYAMLRMDLADGSTLSRSALLGNTMSGFLRPGTTGGTSVTFPKNGFMSTVNCTNGSSGTCTATVNVAPANTSRMYIRLGALYQTADVTITAKQAGGGDVEFTGAQAVIDSTGKAQDVLRRIVISKPLTGGAKNPIPNGAIESGDSVCKRFRVSDGFLSVIDDFLGGDGNPLCESGTYVSAATPSAGTAEFGTGCIEAGDTTCTPGGGATGNPNAVFWKRNFTNTSNNPAAMVTGCTWEWGDAAYGDPTPVETDKACYYGDQIAHTFAPTTKPPTQCYRYTVKLTVFLSNGQKPVYIVNLKEPHGAGAPNNC